MMTGLDQLSLAVRAASARPEVAGAVADLYAELMRRIDLRRPRCDASGRCCRFEEFGHRLYVTTVELAAFLRELPPRRSTGVRPVSPALSVSLPVVDRNGGCPFQLQGLCSVHPIRPFGCRVFFCDPTATQWQQDQYEEFHAELKRLHDRLEVPYFYVEWRQALTHLGLGRM